MQTYRWSNVALCLAATLLATPAVAEKRYGPGVSDTEIKIGQTMPYSGPLSGYGTIGRVEAAYFHMINDKGGINGRKINFISLDDGYQPPKTVEATRRLVEQDEVLLLFNSLGTPTNNAIHKYVNAKKVPHIFLATGATKWGDPVNFPWTMGWQPHYQGEAKIYAQYLLATKPNAKIGVLYQNDDAGKDYLKGLKDGLGARAAPMIVKEVSYDVGAPTVDSQLVELKASGADTFFNFSSVKFAALAIRKAAEIDWRPVQFVSSTSSSVQTVMVPAGVDNAVGVVSSGYVKDPGDPKWADTPEVKDYHAFMKQHAADLNPGEGMNAYGYSLAQTLVHVLKQCGDDLTRENVMRQAANIRGLQLPMLRPGIRIDTSPADFYPIQQLQLIRFDGKHWQAFGEVLSE
jgi:branched-chain amino acid transport system substrate-binding protein